MTQITNIDTTPTTEFTERIVTGDKIYSIGETIELLMEVEEDTAQIIGHTITVLIIDQWNNALDSITANLIGTSLYSAQWKIPKVLAKLYNPTGQLDTANTYNLTDKWIMPGNTSVQFNFQVSKLPLEQPVSDNSILTLSFDGVQAQDPNYKFDASDISFTTHLTPYYATVDEVRGQNKEFLSVFDNYEIANEIITYSNEVDLTLKPNVVTRQAAFDYAVSQWVSYSCAYSLISSGAFNNLSEEKEIDTFKVAVTRNEKGNVLKHMLEYISNFENIILAGGKDNPFQSRTFVKGIFDPNRTNIKSLNLSGYDRLPYVNKTTQSFPITDMNGNTVEVRGTHTVAYLGYGYGYGYGGTIDPMGGSNFTPAEDSPQEAWSHD